LAPRLPPCPRRWPDARALRSSSLALPRGPHVPLLPYWKKSKH